MKNPDQLRHILKTISWRIIGTIDTMMISYLITNSISIGMAIGGFEVFTKMLLYYLHERVWFKYVSLGRHGRDENPVGPKNKMLKSRAIEKQNASHSHNPTNIVAQPYSLNLQDRIKKNGHLPKVFWMTGLSGSGKSTLANAFQNLLFTEGYQVYVLDGDNVRGGLNKDLDFSDSGRVENIRRISEVAKLYADAGFIVITAFISPFQTDREHARNIIGSDHFCEVFVDAPIELCEKRDVKGLYKKARAGEIANFTGITSSFERPNSADIILNTSIEDIETSVNKLMKFVNSTNRTV